MSRHPTKKLEARAARSGTLPEVLTVSESGFPGVTYHTRFSFFAPRTPAEFAASLKAEAANCARMVKEAGARAD